MNARQSLAAAMACAAVALTTPLARADVARERPSDADADRRAYADYRRRLDAMLAAGSAPEPAAGESLPRCRLGDADARLDASPCMECHRSHGGHPVDLDYAARAGYRGRDLRSPAEVVARGVFLPDGWMRCQTCHDARSPWKHRLALPPGAPVSAAVNPRVRASWAGPRAAGPVAPGDAVTPTPLCRACHTLGD
jgi:hypothetical protein